MKLLLFDDFKLGVLRGDAVVDVSDTVKDIPHTGPGDLISGLIARFADYGQKIEDAAARAAASRFRGAGSGSAPPLPKPTNIVCMAVNYMEDGTRTEPAPINAFHEVARRRHRPGDTMVLPDVPATIFEGEAEMAVVIGKRATDGAGRRRDGATSSATATSSTARRAASCRRQHVLPDEVARHLRAHRPLPGDRRRDRGSAQAADPALGERHREAGLQHQRHGPQDPALHRVGDGIHTLEPGDILATGTNHRGLSGFQDGDRIELETEGLGQLRFNIRDDLKRTWSRETRLDRQEKGQEGTTPQLTGKYKK